MGKQDPSLSSPPSWSYNHDADDNDDEGPIVTASTITTTKLNGIGASDSSFVVVLLLFSRLA